MIFVWIRIDRRKDAAGILAEKLVKEIPKRALEILKDKSNEIDVKVEPFGPMDYHMNDLQIMICTDNSSTVEKAKIIAEKIEKLIPKNLSTFVWVILPGDSFFVKISPKPK